MKKIVLIWMLLPILCLGQNVTDEINEYHSTTEVISVKAANGTACSAEVIDECGTAFNTSNYGETNTGNSDGWSSQGQDWFNDLDNNSSNGTFNSGSYAGINGGNADVAYSVENDIFYTFYPTTIGNWDITIAPSNCVSSTGGATANGFQFAVFEGSGCGNFGSGLIAGGVNGQNHTTSQTVTINVVDPTLCIFIQIDGYAGTQCDFGVTLTAPAGGCILPIELTSFTVKNDGNVNIIDWVTASENNNDYYTLERSADGLNWEFIDRIDGTGSSSTESSYQLVDNSFNDTLNYYRLTQTDFDGSNETFNPIVINNFIKPKLLVKTINLMGQEVDYDENGFVIEIYSDGTRKKLYRG